MAARDGYPKPRASSSHYFLTFSRGERFRCFALRPWALWSLVCAAPFVFSAYLGATLYLVCHDDMLAGLMARQSEMKNAYEERLAAMRAQVDKVTSRQLLDQNTIEGRVHDLLSRQAQIENRTSVIAALAQQTGAASDAARSAPKPVADKTAIGRSQNPLLADQRPLAPLPSEASAFAPTDKPRPETIEQRSAIEPVRDPGFEVARNEDLPVDTRLRALAGSLQGIELAQVRAVDKVGAAARQSATRLRGALRSAGLPVDRMVNKMDAGSKGVGGPFVPLKADPNGSLFEREVYRMQNDFVDSQRLTQLVRAAPLRKPVSGPLEVTSPFGSRIDPFLGRLAMHTGVDLRESAGSPARATAAGRVVSAGWAGGYGNMVEIEHGNGLATRYAHLSSILVREGQNVEARETIGLVGSTGRSTGSHLHYEVRVDGEPVDPMRFLRAGDLLATAD